MRFTSSRIRGRAFGSLLAAFVFMGCDDRPVVSVSMTPLTLDERVPDELAVTFTVVGSIPDGGLVLEFGSDTPGALNEFDVTGSNPRQPGETFEPRAGFHHL